MAEIRTLRKADLGALEPLLRASFGSDDFDLQDELDTFDETREDWFVLLTGPRGLIRYFSLAEGLFIGELYAAPGPERTTALEELLKHFLAHHRLPQTARLRLDTLSSDTDLNLLLSHIPNAASKSFAHYQHETPAQPRTPAEKAAPFGRQDLEIIQNILGVLKRYSLADLGRLDRAGALLAVRDGDVKAALHVETRGADGLGVVTLATDPNARRRGHAFALLQHLFAKHPGVSVSLKVEVINDAAVRLYERAGFRRDEAKTERWWYLPLERLS